MLSDERGMTLPELLVAMSIAIVVSLAAFTIVEVVMRRSGEVSARVETTQRARAGMDDMTRQLRSQVCVLRADPRLMTTARSIYAAKSTEVQFFADTADESWRPGVSELPQPTLRTLKLTEDDLITETIRPGVAAEGFPGLNAVTFAGTGGERTRTLLSDVAETDKPLFRFYAFDNSTPPEPKRELVPGPGGLSEADLQAIARISISLRVLPTDHRADDPTARDLRGSIVLSDDVTVRSADPNEPTPNPSCM